MIERLLPAQVDNRHRGHPLALWLFGAVVLMKTGIGLGTLFNGRQAATHADGIALDSFSPAGADAFLSLFAAWGLEQVMVCALCWLVLLRYRALVPLMFAVLLFEHLARKTIFYLMPIARVSDAAPGFYINLALVAVMVVGLVLALRRAESAPAA